MNEELKRKYLKKTVAGIVIIIAAAVIISGVFIALKIIELDKTKSQLEEAKEKKYAIDMENLSFLKENEKKTYGKKLIEACDAYDLKKMNKVIIDKSSIDDNKEASMWEWTIYCDDSKHTSFRCGFKKSTKEFTIEREYSIDKVTSENMEKNETAARSFDVSENDSVKICNVDAIKLPENKLLDTGKKKKDFSEGMKEYLAYVGVSKARSVEFESYNEYGGKKHVNECIFMLKGSKGKKYTKLSAVYRNKNWEYAIIY